MERRHLTINQESKLRAALQTKHLLFWASLQMLHSFMDSAQFELVPFSARWRQQWTSIYMQRGLRAGASSAVCDPSNLTPPVLKINAHPPHQTSPWENHMLHYLRPRETMIRGIPSSVYRPVLDWWLENSPSHANCRREAGWEAEAGIIDLPLLGRGDFTTLGFLPGTILIITINQSYYPIYKSRFYSECKK